MDTENIKNNSNLLIIENTDMKDIKRCYICGRLALLRKYSGACSYCIEMLSKVRGQVRSSIYGSLKYGINSYIWKFLPYSVDELKNHLESQFEPWMTWKNWGKYNSKTWNDNDPATWTWNIDHIIPQYNFVFTSVKDVNFIDCWSLCNLRPYSSKKNAKKHIKERKANET